MYKDENSAIVLDKEEARQGRRKGFVSRILVISLLLAAIAGLALAIYFTTSLAT